MKRHNHQENTIRYGEPLTASLRRRRRFPGPLFNERSPEVAGMTAHLRASAYGERKNGSGEKRDYAQGGAPTVNARSFLSLGQEYDSQARSNFASETVLFAIIIIAAGIWPVVQSVRALAF